VISEADDHPDVEELHRRSAALDPGISIATVYRTVRLFEEAGILDRHDFGDGRARYEAAPEAHHDHLIDVETGKVLEFVDPELEALQKQIAEKLGYRLVDHRMELYGVKLDRDS
jgi:Fur family ferric uptake transcriptional regulator